MAAYTVVSITRDGTGDLTPTAVAASDTFVNDGRTFLHVVNADASPTSVTFDVATDYWGSEPTQETTATAEVVAAGTEEFFGPFPPGVFGDNVTVNYSNQTSITAMAYRLPAA